MKQVISALYCPGNRPDRFEKALTAADQLILDLQDSVALDQKEFALNQVVQYLTSKSESEIARIQVRVESTEAERTALDRFSSNLTIRVSRVETQADLHIWSQFQNVIPLVETALGMSNLGEIGSQENVASLAIGELDLTTELAATSPDIIRHLRIQLVLASAANGLPAPMMSAWTKLSDSEGLKRDCIEGRSLGFTGRTAIHPDQVPIIEEIFSPDRDPSADRRVTQELIEKSGGVAVDAHGNMVDQASLRGRRLRRT